MSDFSSFLAEDRRGVILRVLDSVTSANDGVIQVTLEEIGHVVSLDVVRSDMHWLYEQGLVTVNVILGRVHVATITERGVDVARGRAVVPGIKPPPRG